MRHVRKTIVALLALVAQSAFFVFDSDPAPELMAISIIGCLGVFYVRNDTKNGTKQ